MEYRERTIAAVAAAVASYMEEEERALRKAVPQRRPAAVLSPWSSSGRDEIMRMRLLWQRRIASRRLCLEAIPRRGPESMGKLAQDLNPRPGSERREAKGHPRPKGDRL